MIYSIHMSTELRIDPKTIANSNSHYQDADEFTMSPMNLAPVLINARVAFSSMNTKFRNPKAVLINYRA